MQRRNSAFSQIPVDLTIEQTINRDSKTKGGIIGFSGISELTSASRDQQKLQRHGGTRRKCEQAQGLQSKSETT